MRVNNDRIVFFSSERFETVKAGHHCVLDGDTSVYSFR